MAWTRFDDHLGRLSRAERTAFVGALLTARGWDVKVDPPLVLATKERQHLVVAVAREGLLPGHGLPTESVDVVVGIDSERTERLATARDARAWDARALYEVARHGLDEDATRRLFGTHFGVTDADVRPPTTLDDVPAEQPSTTDHSAQRAHWLRPDTSRFESLTPDSVSGHARRVGVLVLAVILLVGPPLTILGVTEMPAGQLPHPTSLTLTGSLVEGGACP